MSREVTLYTRSDCGLCNEAIEELWMLRGPLQFTLIARNVDVGQTVAASLSAPTLFLIAADLSDMQVNASIDESDVGQIHDGQPVFGDEFNWNCVHGRRAHAHAVHAQRQDIPIRRELIAAG